MATKRYPLPLPGALIIEEEKSFILPDGTADGTADIELLLRLFVISSYCNEYGIFDALTSLTASL